MTIQDLKKAAPLLEELESINRDMKHLQKLAFILSDLDCSLEFDLKIEHEKEYDAEVESKAALKEIEGSEMDELQQHLKNLRESMNSIVPVGIIQVVKPPKENKVGHELSGAISEVVGLEILGVLLRKKIEKKGEIEEKLMIIGLNENQFKNVEK